MYDLCTPTKTLSSRECKTDQSLSAFRQIGIKIAHRTSLTVSQVAAALQANGGNLQVTAFLLFRACTCRSAALTTTVRGCVCGLCSARWSRSSRAKRPRTLRLPPLVATCTCTSDIFIFTRPSKTSGHTKTRPETMLRRHGASVAPCSIAL